MVIHLLWKAPWQVGVISLGVLVIAIAFLICCLCWDRKEKSLPPLCMANESGLNKQQNADVSDESETIEANRRFKFTFIECLSHLKDSLKSHNTSKVKINTNEADLNFNSLELHLIHEKFSNVDEDMKSCVSYNSNCSFYSVCP